MKDFTKDAMKEFAAILLDVLSNVIYLAGIALIELILRPLFDASSISLLSNLVLTVAEISLLLGLIAKLYRAVEGLAREIERSKLLDIIGRGKPRRNKPSDRPIKQVSIVRLALRDFARDFVFIVVTILTITALGSFIYINQISAFGIDTSITMLSFMIATAFVFMLTKMPRSQKDIVQSKRPSIKPVYTPSPFMTITLVTRLGVNVIIGIILFPFLIYNIAILLSILVR